jgi:hypothetical protein
LLKVSRLKDSLILLFIIFRFLLITVNILINLLILVLRFIKTLSWTFTILLLNLGLFPLIFRKNTLVLILDSIWYFIFGLLKNGWLMSTIFFIQIWAIFYLILLNHRSSFFCLWFFYKITFVLMWKIHNLTVFWFFTHIILAFLKLFTIFKYIWTVILNIFLRNIDTCITTIRKIHVL